MTDITYMRVNSIYLRKFDGRTFRLLYFTDQIVILKNQDDGQEFAEHPCRMDNYEAIGDSEKSVVLCW